MSFLTYVSLFITTLLALASTQYTTAQNSTQSSNSTTVLQSIDSLQSDINAVNYILSLEYLQSTYYNTYQSIFTPQQFNRSQYGILAYNNLNVVRLHDTTHVEIIESIINELNGTSVSVCQYNYGRINGIGDYIR